VRIVEIYQSIQGEGRLTGTPSVFVRASGCNLRCWFCDTPYASWKPEGEDWSVDEIVAEVQKHDADHIVITGGEPMLFAELVPLCHRLKELRKHITIETAGTLYLPLPCDLMSISPKLAGSAPSVEQGGRWRERHEQSRHVPDVIRRLTEEHDYQLKFVINQPSDLESVEHYLDEFPHVADENVWLMPQGTDQKQLEATAAWLEPQCRLRGWNYCPRKHIEWFGATRGT
jgi:7-carboxy-7-deazaguanine synthase